LSAVAQVVKSASSRAEPVRDSKMIVFPPEPSSSVLAAYYKPASFSQEQSHHASRESALALHV